MPLRHIYQSDLSQVVLWTVMLLIFIGLIFFALT
jgi:hypothetical protein